MKTCKNYDFCTKLKEGIKASEFHPLPGYNPLEQIRGAAFWWVPVPFHGVPIWMKLRCLNQTQFMAVNNLTAIDIRTKKEKKKQKKMYLDELIDIYNNQEALVEACLVTPTFQEIIDIIMEEDNVLQRKKQEFKEVNKLLEEIDIKDKKYKELKKKADNLELFLGFLLPNDMMGFISSWSQGIDITDIKRLSRKLLLESAILAKNGNNNPSDNLSGIFTDIQKNDINKAAWVIYNEYMEDKQAEQGLKKQKYQWIGAKNSK